MDDLDYITTDEMIEELKKRHEALVIVGLKDLDSDRCAYILTHTGGLVKCLGLAGYASTMIQHDIVEDLDVRQSEAEDVEL